MFDELETKVISLQREAERRYPAHMAAFNLGREMPTEILDESSQNRPRVVPAHKLVDSYKQSPSAKLRNKK